jgi:hypothetical protein
MNEMVVHLVVKELLLSKSITWAIRLFLTELLQAPKTNMLLELVERGFDSIVSLMI